ncbi:hypothetical protein MPSEU_000578600 [Mayamaea pseudoterrestris]|nr:hypothetical protein MPSEU_000578600 [Mayamaea pseudoterrestris]
MSRLLAAAPIAILCCALIVISTVEAFAITTSQRHAAFSHSSTRLNMGWMDAFKNDDSLGKPQNAGLTNGPTYNENVSVNGKTVNGAVVGQKLTVIAGKARVKIPVNCQKGDCGTCVVNLNGRKVKACQTPLPAGKAAIQTL